MSSDDGTGCVIVTTVILCLVILLIIRKISDVINDIIDAISDTLASVAHLLDSGKYIILALFIIFLVAWIVSRIRSR